MPPAENDDRGADPFGPPAVPTLVGCLHCHQEYESYLIERRQEPDGHGVPRWWWCCPTEGCGGRGFGFDILPCDRDWTDEDGERMWSDDADEDDDEFDDLDDSDDPDDEPPDTPRRPDRDDGIPF
jgi:hypothetical protein